MTTKQCYFGFLFFDDGAFSFFLDILDDEEFSTVYKEGAGAPSMLENARPILSPFLNVCSLCSRGSLLI